MRNPTRKRNLYCLHKQTLVFRMTALLQKQSFCRRPSFWTLPLLLDQRPTSKPILCELMELANTDNHTVPAARRLLLVEDNELLAEATAEFLRDGGLEVRVAETGREALALVVEFRPEIVLCDLNLPDMGGIDIARALRKDSATRSVLFVIHTAFRETDFADAGVRDIDLFLSKPMDEEKLEKLLRLKADTFEDDGSGAGGP